MSKNTFIFLFAKVRINFEQSKNLWYYVKHDYITTLWGTTLRRLLKMCNFCANRKIMRMYEEQIKIYEEVREKYQRKVVQPMSEKDFFEYAEVLFSAHSCAIEGNSFSVNDTREQKEAIADKSANSMRLRSFLF